MELASKTFALPYNLFLLPQIAPLEVRLAPELEEQITNVLESMEIKPIIPVSLEKIVGCSKCMFIATLVNFHATLRKYFIVRIKQQELSVLGHKPLI